MKRNISTEVQLKESGKRLDKWLAERFNYRSRSQWQQSIKIGEISLNARSPKSSTTIYSGDIVKFSPQEVLEPEVSTDYEILYEDADLLGIDKPGNLPCHPSGRFFENTLWFFLQKKYGKIHFVSRLDRETSGVMLVAKNPKTASILNKQFKEKHPEKEYLVLVHGKMSNPIHAEGYLIDNPDGLVRKKRFFVNSKDFEKNNSPQKGEYCCTDFFPEKTFADFSLVRVLISTGRLHQIRATACSLGYPVGGDKLYGLDEMFFLRFIEGKLTDSDRKLLLFERQALHSRKITFNHPSLKIGRAHV